MHEELCYMFGVFVVALNCAYTRTSGVFPNLKDYKFIK